jgi:AcrR family transcriptional regulator
MKHTLLNKAEQTRQFIIEKAAPIFNKKGFAGTSLSDLTEATGLTKGSIYGNFKDKDDVAACVLKYNLDALLTYLNRSMEREETSIDKLLSVPRSYDRLYPRIMEFGGCPIMNTAIEADDTHAALSRMTLDAILRLKKIVIGIFESGIAAGEIAPTVDPLKISDVIFSLIEGALFLSKITGDRKYMTHSLEQVESLILSCAAAPTTG